MSDSNTDNDTIHQLLQKLASLEATVSVLQNQPRDSLPPNQIEAPRARILVLPEDLKEAVPAITGKHFYAEPTSPDDDPVYTGDVVFPKNPEQQYSAPVMELPWPDKAKSHQAFDKSLVRIQDRLAFITRPVDEFAADAFSSIEDPDIRQSVLDFTQIVRSQLAITARQITKMRTENYVWAKGLKPAPDKGKGVSISKDELKAEIKAAEDFAKASAPSKTSQSSNNNSQSGRGKNNRGYRGGYFGRFPQQQYQQQQFQQQYQPPYFPQVQGSYGYPSQGYDEQFTGHQGQYFQRGGRGRGRGQARKQQ
ncbi:hypothetical protein BGX28_002665 [Mortierella sp. GBA30]|nr:hypothetical protein BGX28_002665 [Mortierella sp. GBA30]